MKLKIEITMDNAAFDPDPTAEVVRIIQRFVDNTLSIWPGGNVFKVCLLDINGTRVGEARVTR